MARGFTIRLICTVFLLAPSIVWSQVPSDSTVEKYAQERLRKYEEFVKNRQRAEHDFIDKRNAEYAEFLEQKWRAYQSYVIRQDSSEPQLKKPVVKPRKEKVRNRQLPCCEVIIPKKKSVFSSQVPNDNQMETSAMKVNGVFYGTPYEVRLGNKQRYKIETLSNSDVSKAWRRLSDSSMKAVLQDCLTLRKQFQLDDWGYIRLLECITEDFFGSACSEAVLMQVYLLVRSGYQAMPAVKSNRLFLLVECEEDVKTGRYVMVDGHKYLVFGDPDDASVSDLRYHISTGQSPKDGQPISLQPSAMPLFSYSSARYGLFCSHRYPEVKVKIASNQNIVDYCNDYQVFIDNQWAYYVYASLSQRIKDTLYPVLQSNIRYKTQKEAVDVLLDFMQTAFLYKDDISQFGYERPFWGDENFYYPYNDCEDRAILLAILVRDLLDLDVILVHYPARKGKVGHAATAIKFTEEGVTGGYFLVDEDRYVICDPSNINQGVGACMSDYRDVSARLIVL